MGEREDQNVNNNYLSVMGLRFFVYAFLHFPNALQQVRLFFKK